MPTTVHLPPELIKRIDERARGRGVSRNQYIRKALETMVADDTTWSTDFLKALDDAGRDKGTRLAVAEMRRAIARRPRKGSPKP